MKNEFIDTFKQDFIASPSNSEADNALVSSFIAEIDLKNESPSISSMTKCLLGWQTKKLTRHLIDKSGDKREDVISARWSPGFYRIATGLECIEKKLRGAKILDTFAGSGSMMFSLLALNIPESVFLNDLSYKGGQPIFTDTDSSRGYFYNPQQNLEEYRLLFERYQKFIPSPNFNLVTGYACEDAGGRLSHDTGSFDLIFTDPPYNKNLSHSGMEGLIASLPELLRISREGAILMIPESWLSDLEKLGSYKVENLSGGLVHKKTTFRTILIHVH